MSYATALRYARQESVATPHLQGYSRDSQFGDWQKSSSLCGYGTTRDYVLKRDMTNVVMNQYCKVESGDFADPYTGHAMHFVKGEKTSTLVQIDHKYQLTMSQGEKEQTVSLLTQCATR